MNASSDEFRQFVDELVRLIEKNKEEIKNEPDDLPIDPESPIPRRTMSQKLVTIIEEEQRINTTLAGLASNNDGSKSAGLFLNIYRFCYLDDENPIHLWRIYQHCRNYGLQIPVRVLEYFDEVAAGLLPEVENDALRPTDEEGKQPSAKIENEGEFIRSAVTGPHTVYEADLTLRRVTAAILNANVKNTQDVADVFGVDPHTIRRWIRKIKSVG